MEGPQCLIVDFLPSYDDVGPARKDWGNWCRWLSRTAGDTDYDNHEQELSLPSYLADLLGYQKICSLAQSGLDSLLSELLGR